MGDLETRTQSMGITYSQPLGVWFEIGMWDDLLEKTDAPPILRVSETAMFDPDPSPVFLRNQIRFSAGPLLSPVAEKVGGSPHVLGKRLMI